MTDNRPEPQKTGPLFADNCDYRAISRSENTPKMSSGEPMTDHTAGQREPSAPSRGSRPAFITVPLGDGLVGIAFTRDETGAAGILMRPLKEGHAIGTMAKDAEDCGIFIRCPKRESAEVLMRNVRKLVESFGE